MLILALHRSKIQVLIASNPSDNIVTLEQPEGQCWNVTMQLLLCCLFTVQSSCFLQYADYTAYHQQLSQTLAAL